MKKTTAFTRLIKSALLLVSVTGLLMVQGCSGSSSSPAPNPDQVASGLYKDGAANLNGGVSTPTDLIGFVHDNRFIVFSVSAHLLIDGAMTAPTGDSYTATADVYESGVKTQTGISVTGTVTTESSLSLTLAGAGLGSGTIDLLFDPLYGRGATNARIELRDGTGSILMSFLGMETTNFDAFFPGDVASYNFSSVRISPSVDVCRHNGDYIIPDASINIYTLQDEISITSGCATTSYTGYTGFAAVIDGTNADDTILYAVTNGTNSVFAIITKPLAVVL